MDKQKKLRILILILLVGFVVMLIINLIPENKEKANKVLNQASSLDLMKYLRYDMAGLEKSEIIPDNVMLKVALSYMRVDENYKNQIKYNDENYTAIVNLTDINQVVKYIFNKNVDYTKVSFEVSNEKIQIPIVPTSGDAQIYKLNRTEYNEHENVYYAYIDCLEVFNYKEQAEVGDATNTKYDNENVLATIVIKYKIVDERRVLLAYNMI